MTIYTENTALQKQRIEEAIDILVKVGVPKRQQNDRSARTLIALLDIKPETPWVQAKKRPMTIHEIIGYITEYYGFQYAENSRESIRRQTLHQFMHAGLVVLNEDDPQRATNSQHNNYRISSEALTLIKEYGTPKFERELHIFIQNQGRLIERYNKINNENKTLLKIDDNTEVTLSPGKHNKLQIDVVNLMKPKFFNEAVLIYLGDTAHKMLHMEEDILKKLCIPINEHDKLPDIIYYDEKKNILFLIEAVTSHGPVSAKRYEELEFSLQNCDTKRIYITAFPDLKEFKRNIDEIVWESEVWLADAPQHMIHFNGPKFLFVIDNENQKNNERCDD